METKQEVFNAYMEEFKQLDVSQKQDEVIDKLKNILAYFTLYANNNDINYELVKSKELSDLSDNPTTDDYYEAIMVYLENIDEIAGSILMED